MDAMLLAYRKANHIKGRPSDEEKPMKRFIVNQKTKEQSEEFLGSFSPDENVPSPALFHDCSSEQTPFFGEREQTAVPSTEYSRYDASNARNSAKNYAYQRDARSEMDDMIKNYQMQNSHPKSSFHHSYSLADSAMARGRYQAEYVNSVFPMPDSEANALNDRELFQQRYPTARTAAVGDALGKALLIIFIGAAFFLPMLFSCIGDLKEAQQSQQELNGYVPVQGVITGFSNGQFTLQGVRYTVYFDYTYEETALNRWSFVYDSQIGQLRIDKNSAVGQTVKVYVDPSRPQNAELAPKPFPSSLQYLLMTLGIIIMLPGLVFMIRCHKGKYLVYHSNGIKHFKKISKFH